MANLPNPDSEIVDNLVNLETIEAITDFVEAFDIADKLGVNLEGLNEIEEIKERLTMEFEKSLPDFINFKEKVCQDMKATSKIDGEKCDKLLDLLEKTKTTFLKNADEKRRELKILEEALQTENILNSLREDFDFKIQSLNNKTCSFVVAGETSAGKSKFLNLLLEEDLLPSKLEPCTSVITRLSYDKTRHAKIIYHDHTEKAPEIYENVTRDQLRPLIFEENLDKREKTSDVKEVQIFLPSRILENGLVLIDSPGIGENEDMDKVIEDFVEENHVMGFIYIIKSDNGGGMDEDRLIKLMKIILQKQSLKGTKSSFRFDPRCAMFVCNIWDRVTEKQKVNDYIIKRLNQYWPHFNEQKVVKFSTTNAEREIKMNQDYIIKDYQKVQIVLQTMHKEALDERIKAFYTWIRNVLIRSIQHLKMLAKKLNTAQIDLSDNMKKAAENLDEIMSKSTKVITELRELILCSTEEISEECRKYLQNPMVRLSITQWIDQELPSTDDSDGGRKDWDTIKAELDCKIYEKIGNELVSWEEKNGRISQVKTTIISEIKRHLKGLSNEINDLEENLSSSRNKGKRESIATLRPQSISNSFKDKSNGNTYNDRRGSVISYQSNSQEFQFQLSVRAINKVFQPFFNFLVNRLPGRNKMDIYMKDKAAYAKERSEKLLDQLVQPPSKDQNPLKCYIEVFMKEAKDMLDHLILKIPNSIKTNLLLINHVQTSQKDSVLSRRIYDTMMKDFEMLKCLLGIYGTGYIFVEDFKPGELQILNPNDPSGRSSIPFRVSDFLSSMSSSQVNQSDSNHYQRGMWTAHQQGLLYREEGNHEYVSLKIYLPSCQINNCISEIAKLRLIEHKHVADFLGVQYTGDCVPTLVYKGSLRSLQHHVLKNSRKDVCRILDECGDALECLHRNGLVHMELNMNTVMVDSSTSVCLTGGCLPRKADLPKNPEQHISGNFVYLSPEVLKGDVYTATADIYAYGLLFFDLISKASAFQKQRVMSLDLFVQSLDPVGMMDFESNMPELDESGKDLIKSCLQIKEEDRPSISHFRRIISQLKEEDCFPGPQNAPTTFTQRIDCGRV